MNWGRELLQMLQEVRANCKTRNQLRGFLPIAPKTIIPDSGRLSSVALHGHFCQFTDDRVHIWRVWLLQELESTLKIDVLPGDGRDLFGCVRTLRIPGSLLVLQEPGKDGSVVKDDAISHQAAAFRPIWPLLTPRPGVRLCTFHRI